jgi:Flp pilus assembly protein TadB
MSLLDKLRKDAARDSDPEVRRQRVAKLNEVEAEVQDFHKRLAAVNAKLAESVSAGRRSFFSWIEFIYGLGAVAALVASFYFELPPAAWIIILCTVIFAMVGVHVFIVRSRVKKLDRSA